MLTTRWGYLRSWSWILLFLLLHYTDSLPERGLGKGSICKDNSDCDQTRFLACVGDKCGCRSFLGLSWVEEEHSCMIMESHPCGRRRGREGKCVPNSSCQEGKCECDEPSYLRNGLGHCELGWGEPCAFDKDVCSRRHSLECFRVKDQNGTVVKATCKCRGEGMETVWDWGKQKCLRTAGERCDLEGETKYERVDQLECSRDSDCLPASKGGGICRCKPGFKQVGGKGKCFLQYGQKCEGNDPLGWNYCDRNKGLICQEGKCACEFYGQMTYDNESQQCRILVGESCSLQNKTKNESNPICVKGSVCESKRGSTTRGICSCFQGFEMFPDRSVCSKYRGHGHPCWASTDCDHARFMECVAGNIPEEHDIGRCDCLQNQMEWDGKECRVRPGKSCQQNSLCAKNSHCGEGKKCACRPGYELNGSNCVKKKEVAQKDSEISTSSSAASSEEDLHPDPCTMFSDRGLQWKECQCLMLTPSTHIWMASEASCLGLVGTSCQLDFHCVPHALCDARHHNTCQCHSSELTTPLLECLPPPSKKMPHHQHLYHHDHHHPCKDKDCPEIYSLKSVSANSGRSIKLGEPDPIKISMIALALPFFQIIFIQQI